ncbi:hypothetical protein MML48_10g00001244 [Holotrichia oblita]|uniref:Uncharacterized protein n=1 Tax=Holotrichia oblita TaxID=644536 RepID=A0ACB9SI38_HOLOL|nr:hypothetical protein MML48_10g00001244 [Holotrichia oblita]
MDYEKEEGRLLRMWEEICAEESPDDGEEELALDADIVENRDTDSESEQDCETTDDEENAPTPKIPRIPCFVGRDNTTNWWKHVPKRTSRTRQENIIVRLPGVKNYAKNAKTGLECCDLKEFLQKSGAVDILDDPSRILNADESGFSLCPKTGKVLGLKGHNTYVVKKGNEKENLTVLVTFTGDGRMCPPVVVFPYVKPPKAVVDSIPEQWILGKSESGWMHSDVFYEFVANGLNCWLTEQRIQKPVFFVNGHRSHLSIDLSQFCDPNGIFLYAFPPNATHLIQPADVSVFKPILAAICSRVADRT